MQLARTLWLDASKSWKRKATECVIALILEAKLSKKEIFEYYSNQIYLGEHETFSIHGFGEAARVSFNKDLSQLTLAEAALLAGMVQRPSYFDPRRHPERAIARRNLVLSLMRQNGYINADQEKMAASAASGISSAPSERGDAPYFLPLVTAELQGILGPGKAGDNSYRVYTTLDERLQRAAVEAVRLGMQEVDNLLRRKRNKAHNSEDPQVALVALDAHTGEIKALVGGRNYSSSQLNHALSKRQPGSVFKPFVYAAALSATTAQDQYLFTPSSMVEDSPATFYFGKTAYQPGNFGDRYYGNVTLRQALARSMNTATVRLAERVGYSRVVALARQAGLNDGLKATPAIALGAYEATPLEIAGAYTVFANEGTHLEPIFVSEVRSSAGKALFRGQAEQRAVLDPRVAFLMRDMLEEVLRSGTAAGVRARGFTVPAAGKTGTSRDGWFAGFTSNLICVVWVGFDDNSELNLEGAKSALPIWTEFMKRATQSADVASPFDGAPAGIVTEQIDPETGDVAGPQCPSRRMEYFIAGSEPQVACALHAGGALSERVGERESGGNTESASRK
jgi:penicillin-binding protein 1B